MKINDLANIEFSKEELTPKEKVQIILDLMKELKVGIIAFGDEPETIDIEFMTFLNGNHQYHTLSNNGGFHNVRIIYPSDDVAII